MSNVLDLQHAGDPRDAIHRAVHRLADGELVGLPTETLYVAAAHALQPSAVERLGSAQPDAAPLSLALKSGGALLDYVPDLSDLGRKLARRCWPGPVVLAVDPPREESLLHALPAATRSAVGGEGDEVRFRCPAHDVVSEVLRLMPAPLVLSSERSAAGGAETAAALSAQFGQPMALILDDGPARYAQPATVVRVRGDEWAIAEPGVVTETMIRRLAGDVYLFVCTGNTCRSPMAEGLFRRLLAERLGCSDDELADRGFIVLSAGLSAASGAPASGEAVELFRQRGIDLRGHASQPLTDRLLEQADHILAMTRGHRDAIVTARPEVADRVTLLARDGGDISDPIGGTPRDYEECQQQIEFHLRAILDDLEFHPDEHSGGSATP